METLADRISRDGPLNELDAVGWAIRLAKRIEALHALGVAHGSISPECVITTSGDRTSKGILVDVRSTPGRLAYQCPERAAGGTVSPSDDVWGIATTLYEALTGLSPFSGATDAETQQRIANSSPAPLAVFDVGDDDLQHIIDNVFQRDPATRTRTAAALRRALEEWHPDPAVRSLSPLEDEDSTNDDDEDEVRTVMRGPMYGDDPLSFGTGLYGAAPAAPNARPAQVAYGVTRQGQPGHAATQQGLAAPPRAQPPQPAYAVAQQRAAPMVDPTVDDDEDNLRTNMKEVPLQPVYDGGVLYNAGERAHPAPMRAPAPLPAAGMPARVAPTAPDHRPPMPASYQQYAAAPRGAPLTSSQQMAPSAHRAPPAAAFGQPHAAPAQREPPARAGAPLRIERTHVDEEEIETVAREDPADRMPARPARAAPAPFAPAFGSPPSAQVPAQAPLGAFPQPDTLTLEKGGPPRPPPVDLTVDQSPPARPQPREAPQGGLLGPSLIESFGVGRRLLPDPKNVTAPLGAFAAPPSGQGPPSPFAVPPQDLIIPDPPPASNRSALIALIVVAVIIAALVVLFASRTGALG